ncbi:MAG: LysR family transcriptional regulator [Burkholderiales bacterium]|nr:LysR family transcriptional regulator [Burkholderiales bacterium]
MDLADLHIFKTVVEEGGIIRAARKLHRVPSNVTTRIRQLEASVGVPLFFRDKQRLFLSPNGKSLLTYAGELLRLAEEAKGAMAGATPRGVLRLGALESTTASRMPTVLAQFHRAFPDVRVELTTGTNDMLTAAVVDRRLDAAFVGEPPPNGGLSSLPLFDERLMVITALDHARVAHPRDVQGDSVITFPVGCAYRRMFEHWLGDRNFTGVRVLELSSYHAIVACVASGTGIAMVPESVLDTVQSAQVARHRLPKVHSAATTSLIWRSSEQTGSVVALRELLARPPDAAIPVPARPRTRR